MRSFTAVLFAVITACVARAASHCDGASMVRNDNNKFAVWKGVESNWTRPATPGVEQPGLDVRSQIHSLIECTNICEGLKTCGGIQWDENFGFCTLMTITGMTFEGQGTMSPSNAFNVHITQAVESGPNLIEQPFQGVALRGGCDNPHYETLMAEYSQYMPDQQCCEIWYENRNSSSAGNKV